VKDRQRARIRSEGRGHVRGAKDQDQVGSSFVCIINKKANERIEVNDVGFRVEFLFDSCNCSQQERNLNLIAPDNRSK